MSHIQLATLLSLLTISQDPTKWIRDATGHFVLSSINSHDDSEAWIQNYLTYAIELSTVFDFVRILDCNTLTSTKAKLADESRITVRTALAHLLQIFPVNMIGESSNAFRGQPIVRIITRTILSALCIVPLDGHNKQPGRVDALAIAARDLASRLRVPYGGARLLQDICSYIAIAQVDSSERTLGSPIREATIVLKPHPAQLSMSIPQLVDFAIAQQTGPDQKMITIIELCRLYWHYDDVLVWHCSTPKSEVTTQSPKILAGAKEIDEALKTRLLIQQYLATANDSSPGGASQYDLNTSFMFTPGIERSCALYNCQCNVFPGLRASMSGHILNYWEDAYQTYHASCQHFSFDMKNVLISFQCRLEKPNQSQISNCDSSNMPLIMTQRSQSINTTLQRVQSARVHRKLDQLPPLSLSSRAENQPTASSPYSRPRLPLPNGSYFDSIAKITTTEPEETDTHSPPALSTGRGRLSSQRSHTSSDPTCDSTPYTPDSIGQNVQVYQNSASRFLNQGNQVPIHMQYNQQVSTSSNTGDDAPEVVGPNGFDSLSLMSDRSASPTVVNAGKSLPKGRLSNFLRGRRDAIPEFVVPAFRFSASGKHILLWTKNGGTYLDPKKRTGWEFSPINEQGIVHAAAGTQVYVVVSHVTTGYKITVCRLETPEKHSEWEIPRRPSAIDVSRDDKYLALKFTRLVRVYSIDQRHNNSPPFNDHDLRAHENNRAGFGNHLVSFSHDSQSFSATTRFEPEKVFTYWSSCTISQATVTACSVVPFGLSDDHGLSSLLLCGHGPTRASDVFLSTFTERGSPVTMAMAPPNPVIRPVRDAKDQIGTRVQCAAMYVHPTTSKSTIVLINQNHHVFWITDAFGREPKTERVATIKRPRSLKPEIQIGMSDAEEARIFYVDEKAQKGILTMISKGGGISTYGEYKLNIEPICAS